MMMMMSPRRLAAAALALVLVAAPALAQEPGVERRKPTDAEVEHAIGKVWPALVQILVLTLEHQEGRDRKFQAAGSGTIVSADGYVVTNHHVAGHATSIRVVLSSKEEIPAKLVGTDALADIAVLKIDLAARAKDAPPLPFASWGSSEKLVVGDPVLAMGCPLALSHSVTRGIVANKDMMMPKMFSDFFSFKLDGEDVGSLVKWIGHDAMIMPGNSGGPLVNLQGELVGVNEIGLGSMSGAIPGDLASLIVKELIDHGTVRRSWIGADFQPLLKSQTGWGVLVGGVVPGSPAEKAGLRAGDVVITLDGEPVRARFREELPAFNLLILTRPVGAKLTLLVTRGQEHFETKLETRLREAAEGQEREAKEWGITAREVTALAAQEMQRADKSGVIVGTLRQGGPCDKAVPAMLANDVIVEIAGKPVASLDDFFRRTREICEGKDEPVPIVVAFDRRTERLLTLVEVGVRAPAEPTAEAKRPWLAVATQVLSKKLAKALGLKGKKGVRVTQVYPESPAEQAGFRTGDVITHIDGTPIEASEPQDVEVFGSMIRNYKVGTKAKFTVWRGTEKTELEATLDEAPKPDKELGIYEDLALEFKARDVAYLDRVKRRWSRDQQGAIVTDIDQGGWASVAHLHVDDLILDVDGKKITGAKDLEAALKPVASEKRKLTVLLVKRGVHTLFVEIEPVW